MNKHQRAEIEQIIQAQIDALVQELPTLGKVPGEILRLRRLESTLMRIDADNFGDCFKCETAIPIKSLRIQPETMICDACLAEPKVKLMAPALSTFHRPTLRLLALLFLFLVLCGCSRHLIYQRAETSRDFTYIDFSRNSAPYIHQGQVGGEHSTFIKVLCFEGDHFSIGMEQQGDAGFTVYGEGVRVDRDQSIYAVTIDAPETLFIVDVSAVSYGDYVLTISKE